MITKSISIFFFLDQKETSLNPQIKGGEGAQIAVCYDKNQ